MRSVSPSRRRVASFTTSFSLAFVSLRIRATTSFMRPFNSFCSCLAADLSDFFWLAFLSARSSLRSAVARLVFLADLRADFSSGVRFARFSVLFGEAGFFI